MSPLNKIIISALASLFIVFALMITLVTNTLVSRSVNRAKDMNIDDAVHVTESMSYSFHDIFRMLGVHGHSLSMLAVNSGITDESAEDTLFTLLSTNASIHRAWIVLEKDVLHEGERYIKEYVNNEGMVRENFILSSHEDSGTLEAEPWYAEPLRTGENYFNITNPHDCGTGDGSVYTAVISMPLVLPGGETIGIYAVEMIYKDMYSQFLDLYEQKYRSLFLLGQDMTILYAYDRALVDDNLADFSYEDIRILQGAMEQGKAYTDEIYDPLFREKVFLHLQPISLGEAPGQHTLYLYISTPLDTLYADARYIAFIMIGTGALSILLALGIIYFFASRIVRPIRTLTRQAQAVTDGDFTFDVFDSMENDLPQKSEIATLRRALMKMMHMLDESLRTVEKKVEERTQDLCRLNQYTKALMDCASSYSLFLDHEAKIQYYSDSFTSMVEVDDDSVFIGMPVLDIFGLFADEEFLKAGAHRISRVMSGENEFSEDDTLTWPNGKKRMYRITYKRITDERDNFAGIVVVTHDITDLRREEADRHFDELLYSTALPCTIWDEKGGVIAYNTEAAQVFGVSDDLSPEDFDHFMSTKQPEYQSDGRETEAIRQGAISEALKKGISQLTVKLAKNDGTPIYFMVNITRILHMYDYRLFVYYHDMTDIKANEQKMREIAAKEREAQVQKEVALAASEAKSRFLANMSHEIRTPLNAVLGMAELLSQEEMNPRQLGYVTDMKTSATALLNIINDILDVSKLQAGKLSLLPVHYDFGVLIDNIRSIAQFLSNEKNIAFKLVIQESAHVCLYGDDVRLRQVLLNLLGNAIKFTDEGSVQLEVDVIGTSIKMTVSDTGTGIPAESIPTLFDAFEQADMSKNRKKQGTGLGLTITKAIVEMMGGQITVESVYGEGTSFHVEIPMVPGDRALVHHSGNDEITLFAPDAKILVVDDNATNLNVASGLLRLHGIIAETAASGEQAIEMIREKRYDIVFMDHRMPEMDGTETTKVIRKMGLTDTIIALTASVVGSQKEKMLQAGMDDYLSKPIIRSELIKILKKWLPAHRYSEPPVVTVASGEDKNGEQEGFWRKVGQIEGLSVSVGLERVGGQRHVYEKTLKLMIREIEKTNKNLTEFLSIGDMKSFRIEVHGVKGALANIGAMEFSAMAQDLETASGKTDVDFCKKNLPIFQQRLNGLNRELKEVFQAMTREGGPIKMPQELPPILERMKNAFSEIDLTVIDDEVEKLKALDLSGTLKEAAEQIGDMVMMMDYDGAEEQIRMLFSVSNERQARSP